MTRPAGLYAVPLTWREAAAFTNMWHRHHRPPAGHKFSIGAATDGLLVGVVIVGRPVTRHFDDGHTLEVSRTTTDGHRNACSFLLGCAARAGFAMGYGRLITYTQEAETGATLRGAGWRVVAERPARRGWDAPSRPRVDRGLDHMPRTLWEVTP